MVWFDPSPQKKKNQSNSPSLSYLLQTYQFCFGRWKACFNLMFDKVSLLYLLYIVALLFAGVDHSPSSLFGWDLSCMTSGVDK